MENTNNQILTLPNNYFEPMVNAYSSNELPSFLNRVKKTQNIPKQFLLQNKNNFMNNKLQSKISFDKINHNSIKRNELKRFNTAKNLRRININTQKNIQYIPSDDDNIVFATKTKGYKNNNGKMNYENKKRQIANNHILAKKIQNQNFNAVYNYKQMNMNYNPKFHSTNKNNILLNNNHPLVDNFIITKKNSNNFTNYNYELNSTMPNQKIKSNNFHSNNIIENNDTLNQKNSIKQNNFLNNSFLLKHKNLIKKRENKPLPYEKTMTDYKKKNRTEKNDLSWDYGIGVLNKGKKLNFYPKNSNLINNNYSKYLSERKKKVIDIDTDDFNDDIDDKDIDEIVDNLDLSFFNDDKKNNTVILHDKGFSDESLSDLADDIVKTFQEIEKEDLNVQETVPSSSNPELDGMTTSTTDIQYNNNYQNQKKIIYETKSTVKPTIVNNFFISSAGAQNKNDNLEKDINYNLFVVNDYNKNYSNSNIPSIVTKTYQSPNILREEKNNKIQNINNNISNFTESEIFDGNKNDELINKNNNNIIQNQNINQNIIIDLNYTNNLNNNLTIPNNNTINNINNTLNSNVYYKNNEQIIDKFDNNNFEDNNINEFKNSNNDEIVYNFKLNDSLKNNIKKNSNIIEIKEPTIKELLTTENNANNIKIYKEKNFISKDGINQKYLFKNKIRANQKNNIENNLNINYSFNKKKNQNYNELKQNNYKSFVKNIDSDNEIIPINKKNNLSGNIYFNDNNNSNISLVKKKSNIIKNNIIVKNKKHISFNLDNNIFIKFRKDDLITNSLITKQNGEIYNHPKINMNIYKKELKLMKPKPIIKTFLTKDIKINPDYTLVENLPERQILPDLYDDFEEEDIKSLEKSLERSVDKTLH